MKMREEEWDGRKLRNEASLFLGILELDVLFGKFLHGCRKVFHRFKPNIYVSFILLMTLRILFCITSGNGLTINSIKIDYSIKVMDA